LIIKKISLKNLRSYGDIEVVFPKGSILLSGDIGSGKTSVLLAIEFALFGLQPSQRGTSLLRNGENDAYVKMEFEVDSKEIIIERTLKRGSKSITQDYCAIKIDGEKQELSVTELKNFILELLNYPLEFAKKQNILYRFTVYTPQEDMKQIILQDSETRLNTLRQVFGVDKYKRIIENTGLFMSKIREERRMKEGMLAGIEQRKIEIQGKEEELEGKYLNLDSVEKELFLRTDQRKKVEEEKLELQKKIEEKNKFEKEREKAIIMVQNKNESLSTNLKTASELKKQIAELSALSFNESKIKQLEFEIQEAKKAKENLSDKRASNTSKIHFLKTKILENSQVKNKLHSIEICPTCLQDVNAVYKSNVFNKLENEDKLNASQTQILEDEQKSIAENLVSINEKISELEKELLNLRLLKVKLQGIEEKQARLSQIEQLNILLEKDISFLKSHAQDLSSSILSFQKYDNLFHLKEAELILAIKEERSVETKIAVLRKEIDLYGKQISELKEHLKQLEEISRRVEFLVKMEDWLSSKFIPLVMQIEKNVMNRLKNEFSELFNKWFSMLVSENFNVRLDDKFTPIIEQKDFEIDYNYLSGGERTAVALAYRLALNQVINSMLSRVKTRDIVILDEPTDGFSSEQLDKMRDVLQELNARQLILVSHEQKIESFVENIIRFRKENGVSYVEEQIEAQAAKPKTL